VVGLLVAATAPQGSEAAAAPEPVLAGVVSGSRLRARFYDGGGGALLFRGWFDSELGLPCAFTRTPNGPMRCLPAGQPAVFSDSTCTMPVWGISNTAFQGTLPRYVTAFVPQGGPAGAAYLLGEPYTGVVRNTSAGVCLDSVVRSSSYTFYRTGAEIPPERFVAAAITLVPVDDGRLVLRTTQADDGSSQAAVEVSGPVWLAWRTGALPPQTFAYLGSGRLRVPSFADPRGQVREAMIGGDFFDAQADAPCHPEPFADGLRCVPRTATGASRGNGAGISAGIGQWAPVTERVE
jgi:hypothetical protein